MAGPDKTNPIRPSGGGRKPEWADGLKRLYDSVVEEPLPDDLAALLAQLDQPKADHPQSKHDKPEEQT